MKYEKGHFYIYGNEISKTHSKKIIQRQNWMKRKFHYDPEEKYNLSAFDNKYIGNIFNLKDILRLEQGEPIKTENSVIVNTIRMGFGHYRIAMAGVSAAHAMGFTPYWLDLLAIPGVPTDLINYCNSNYSFFSRVSQRSNFFNKHIWESITTGEPTLPGLNWFLNNWIISWPWRFLKTNAKDYAMSELCKNLYASLPSDIPMLTSHMWNCMAAVAAGMTNVVDMMFDNWPMSFQLTEGAKHAVQGPAGYYGFRMMRGFDEKGNNLYPTPSESLYFTGHHVDHEIVDNIETDCADRIRRMHNHEPRRLLVTMGGAGAQRELFKSIIDHCIPYVKTAKVALFVNLGDHKSNWDWLQNEISAQKNLIQTHFDWDDTKSLADRIRKKSAEGIHIFLFDNTFQAVYATNYLMRVVDVMITKPSELAFYPVPIIFNQRVGGHEMWGAIRGAEIGNGTVEARSISETLQAIDMFVNYADLLNLYCDCIVKNKSIGIYDGAYKSVELATGKKFQRNNSGLIKNIG